MCFLILSNGKIHEATNHSGGIQGDITNGETETFNVAFKPIPSITMPQQTVDEAGQEHTILIKDRHDVCAVWRAVVLIEALAVMVSVDHLMLFKRNFRLVSIILFYNVLQCKFAKVYFSWCKFLAKVCFL